MVGDTVVVFPPEKDTSEGGVSYGQVSEILEKPISKDEQLRWLMVMAGRSCEVVTGVTIGMAFSQHNRVCAETCTTTVYPSVEAPGYKLE